MQAWPWLWKMAQALPLTAAARSASSNTMFGALAAELELHLLQVAGARLHDAAAGGGAAGEGDLRDLRMLGDAPGPRPQPSPGRMLTTPSGMPASAISSAMLQRGERRDLGRLHHDAVAGGERRRHLPAREHQREVPRHDLADDADRLAQRVVQEARLDRDRLALELVGHAAEVAVAGGRARHVERARVAQRMAGVERFEARQLVGVGLDEVGELEQDAAAVGRRHAAPGREGALRRSDGAVDVLAAGHRHVGDVELSCGFSVASVSPEAASTKRPSMKSWWRMSAEFMACRVHCPVPWFRRVPG